MALRDDGDVIKAVGFIAVYGSYLEDRINTVIKILVQRDLINKKVEKYHLADQVKHLRSTVNNLYKNCGLAEDSCLLFKELLDEIEDIAEKSNHCIHSALESKKGKIIQRNNRRSISKEIKSSELYDLANDIFDLQVGLSRIEFRLKRLFFG